MESLLLLMPLLLVLLTPAVLVIAVIRVIRQQRRLHASWRELASTLGLTFLSTSSLTSPTLRGTLSGVEVWLSIEMKGSNKNRTAWTRFRAQPADPLPSKLQITLVHAFSGIKALLGAQDITTGDTAFDEALVIKGQSEEATRAYLTPARRAILLPFLQARGNIQDGEGIFLDLRGVITDHSTLTTQLNQIAQIALALHEA